MLTDYGSMALALLFFTFNLLASTVKIFRIMYKYTFLPFRHRARAFRPSIACLYARRGCGDDEKDNFRTTRKRPLECSRWSLES